MIKRASRSFQDIQENFFEENLTNIPGRGREKKKIYYKCSHWLSWPIFWLNSESGTLHLQEIRKKKKKEERRKYNLRLIHSH